MWSGYGKPHIYPLSTSVSRLTSHPRLLYFVPETFVYYIHLILLIVEIIHHILFTADYTYLLWHLHS